jgi:CheY-like chemotaxis protein
VTITGRCDRADERATQGLSRGRYVCLAVSDIGTGMDEDTLKRAMDPFFTTKGVGKGTGLGLSMVHGLAAQSGGAMRIESQVGSGTRVELWLPVAEGTVQDPVPHFVDPVLSVADASPPRPCRVLIVDDDPLVRTGTKDMLEDLGHEVLATSSAEEALHVLRSVAGVELVITDHAMPGMTGLELARHVHVIWPSLPVLLATGYADLPEGELSDLPRLTKPYTQEELTACIRRLLEDSKLASVVPP